VIINVIVLIFVIYCGQRPCDLARIHLDALLARQTVNANDGTSIQTQIDTNCLGSGHSSMSCSSKYKCQSCKRSHHSLLHFDSKTAPSRPSGFMKSTGGSTPSSNSVHLGGVPHAATCLVRGQPQSVVLLSTALVNVYAADGRRHVLRALLDCGSQASFITEKACCALMLRRYHLPVSVSTFASTASTCVRGKCSINIVP